MCYAWGYVNVVDVQSIVYFADRIAHLTMACCASNYKSECHCGETNRVFPLILVRKVMKLIKAKSPEQFLQSGTR